MQRAIDLYNGIVVENIRHGRVDDLTKEQAIALFRVGACCLPDDPAMVRLYYLAEQADDRYAAVIHEATRGRKNRWDLSPTEARIPAIVDALDRKKAADARLLAHMRGVRARRD